MVQTGNAVTVIVSVTVFPSCAAGDVGVTVVVFVNDPEAIMRP